MWYNKNVYSQKGLDKMARFKAAAVFSDHMVLQRNKNISVFGIGDDGRKVTVSLGGNIAHADVINGKWTVILPPMAAADGLEMRISDGDSESVFTDIAVGEVWLAGGQSNMELELQNCENGRSELDRIA